MIQPLAYIHPEAKLAPSVVVEPFAVIHKNVEIGEGSWIGSHAVIMEGARIGKNVKVFPGAVISSVPQDLKFEGEDTIAVVGDNTVVRECVTISRGTKDKYKTVVGANCLLMAYVHVAHDCIIGDNCIIANTVQLAGHVEVDDWVVIGGSSAVHQFVKIGAHSMISGGSLVRKDVPPFVKAAREPLSYAGINSIGLRRRGFTSEQISQVQEIYRILYLSGVNNTTAMDKIEMEFAASDERDLILNFFRNSERGMMKGYGA
ncbi:UDP-N-acetylglucosamine acyltransferase [Flexibacter flexilis DSM 6793]|uniref:UDP-N-acetylglucosamine acyltransferase n=1 Tax=Flexibacter flexilis DSM 6793 TaxID=927664 RepID=A0A1I1H1R5_9BACT|nr:acyl-ACP--UDP-N-acetylglucosamine O-acyltransferase [Flexibacter flexilis]SFC17864.1 UDP-N-acetylglucosamine acyltransferase [Flexibacter flexilis DSM 6793]